MGAIWRAARVVEGHGTAAPDQGAHAVEKTISPYASATLKDGEAYEWILLRARHKKETAQHTRGYRTESVVFFHTSDASEQSVLYFPLVAHKTQLILSLGPPVSYKTCGETPTCRAACPSAPAKAAPQFPCLVRAPCSDTSPAFHFTANVARIRAPAPFCGP